MLKSMLVNKGFQTWHQIGWQHSRQPIRSPVRKSLLTNLEFKKDFCLVTPSPVHLYYSRFLHCYKDNCMLTSVCKTPLVLNHNKTESSIIWMYCNLFSSLLPITIYSKTLVYSGMNYETKWCFGLSTTSLDHTFKPLFVGCIDMGQNVASIQISFQSKLISYSLYGFFTVISCLLRWHQARWQSVNCLWKICIMFLSCILRKQRSALIGKETPVQIYHQIS